jgi:hypothetical protein
MAKNIPFRYVEIVQAFRLRVENALKELLESKHIYQSVTIQTDDLSEPLKSGHHLAIEMNNGEQQGRVSQYLSEQECCFPSVLVNHLISAKWIWDIEKPSKVPQRSQEPLAGRDEPYCFIPRLVRPCAKCGSDTAHLPSFFHSALREPLVELDFPPTGEGKRVQLWSLSYQCQVCRGEPNVFLVRRNGPKVTLAGRSIFEKISVPKFIPEGVKEFYSEAIIASRTGNHLPGCLYLRLVIEHQIRSAVDPSKLPVRPTGDELTDQYAKVLHPDFPRSLVSFKTVYADLSEVIHSGREDENVFEQSLEALTKHFDQLRLLPLQNWRSLNSENSPVTNPDGATAPSNSSSSNK